MRPKGTATARQRSVWLAALVTGRWGAPAAARWRLDGGISGWPFADALPFFLLLGDGNVNTNSLSHLHHRGERSLRRSLYLAEPLVLPSPALRTAQKHSNIHLHRHPPSTAVGHLPSSGRRSSCTSHNCHPCSRIPPTPSVPPFYRSTRRLQPAVPASSVHCPLRCPLKTALAKNRGRGVGAAPRQGNPFRSPRLPTERSSLVVFFPFAFRTHAVLGRYLLNCQAALRYAQPSPFLEPPSSPPFALDLVRARETTPDPPSVETNLSRLGCSAFPHSLQHLPARHLSPPPLRRRPLVYPFRILLDLFHPPPTTRVSTTYDDDDCPWLPRPNRAVLTRRPSTTLSVCPSRAPDDCSRARLSRRPYATLCRGGGSERWLDWARRDITSRPGQDCRQRKEAGRRPEQEREREKEIPGMTIAS